MVIFTPLGTTANTFFGTIQLNNNLWLTYDPVNNVVRFSSPTQTNSININMSDGSIGIGTISFSGQALTLPISGASTLSFYDKYHIGRSGSDGLLYFNMTQTGADGVGFQENGVTFDTFKTTGNTVTNTVFSGGISTTNISHISSAVTVGASPFNFTNTTPFCEKYRTSGATAYSVSVNGVGVFGSLAGDIGDTLQPGEFLTITYTVAPTLYTNAW
jgi:hypothetical protein